nr:hypothetical protein CTI12_AA533620 [Tanacetum cinerariifolium]
MILNKVEDFRLGMESYQRTLNLTKLKLYFEGIKDKIPYTMSGIEKGVVYLNQHNRISLMKLNEVKKFCDGTLMKSRENLIDMVNKNELGREQLQRFKEYVGGIPKTIDHHFYDKIGNPLSPNCIECGYSICCKNIIDMINSIKDLREENRDMFSYINEAIKLMLAVATNMSCVVENNIRKEGSKDNLKE